MLGSIRATLGLDESNFTRGMLNAQNASAIFGSTITNFVNNPLLGTIGILKSVASGTVDAIRQTSLLNQEYLRTSERIGISTRTLSGLGMAYRDVGLSSQEMEKQFVILSKLVDDASQGNVTAQKSFDRLGVSITDAAGNVRSLDAILRDVSDGLAAMENAQARVSIASDLFGRGAEKVLDVLGRGGKVIEETIEKASRYGQVVEQDAARASNELASALGDLGFAADGASKRLSTRFITAFIDEFAGGPAAVDALAESIGKLEPAASRTGSVFGRWLADTIEGLGIVGEALEERRKQIEEVNRALSNSASPRDQAEAMLNERTFWSHPISGRSYQALIDAELFRMGASRGSVLRATRGHYPDELEAELEILHRNQERMRRLRAAQ